MAKIRLSFTVAILSLLLSPAAISLSGLPARAQLSSASLSNQLPAEWGGDANFTPADRGRPGGREGGATRSPCVVGQTKLTALVPQTDLGLTTNPYPTFFAYIPKTHAEKVRFTLETEDGREVYTASFDLAKPPGQTLGEAGIASLKLPESVGFKPLEIGQDYRWRYALVCDGGATIFARGWIRRVEEGADLEKALETASLAEKVALYAEENLWHDTLAALHQLHAEQPRDRSVTDALVKLLQAVDLDSIGKAVQGSKTPWLECCEQTS